MAPLLTGRICRIPQLLSRTIGTRSHPMKTPPSIRSRLLVIAAAFSSLAPASRGADLLLTENGQPRAIVVVGSSLQLGDFSTKVLISNVKQMSGATLPA